MILFMHGVPDTPFMWTPLITALGLSESEYCAPALPGFTAPPPAGFSADKDAYADWLISEIETANMRNGGPIDIVGHDWGALLTQRAASLRPDLIRSWVVSNALIDPDYRWHRLARIWQTPLLGELVMARTKPSAMAAALIQGGLPAEIAQHEGEALTKTMRQCILRLYRSAKTAGSEWAPALDNLPANGMIYWGEKDPYVSVEIAKQFSHRQHVPLHIEEGAGHWAIAERADNFSGVLNAFWTQ